MKSDWDDVRSYLRSNKQPSEVGKWLIAGSIGAAITACALFIGGGNTPFQADQETPSQQPVAEPEYEPTSAEYEPTDRSAEEDFWQSVREKESARQSEFNDRNYAPREPQTVVDMSGNQQSNASQPKRSQSNSSKQIEYASEWVEKWSGGGSYLAKWTVVNNRIDGGSVCGNHKRGSIDYRECRKGAKQFFKEECRAWGSRYDSSSNSGDASMKTRYCIAASNFSPMG
jgi:hypothetical protein